MMISTLIQTNIFVEICEILYTVPYLILIWVEDGSGDKFVK